ncbi:hypothetical protein BS47DRAFT_1482336 [Hydnum rufescens UP504]|uniref:Uncharacterized protein n=1 Tax=Hydnum rufescens UP504 TaxID=1448309 RepID=A0A9P6B8V9_9AGAM|nr:hypothetical protein BS47DRAFT_1482336 [Hydnum rufescens UP504]
MCTTGVTLATDLLASDLCTISITLHLHPKLSPRAIKSCYLPDPLRATGFQQQLLVLKIAMMLDDGEAIWFRSNRGPKPENSTPRSSVSRFTPCDSATISSSEAQQLRGLRLEMKAEVIFPVDGPTAGDLRELLNILSQESPGYSLWGLRELLVVLLSRAKILDPFLLWRAEVWNPIT